MTLAAAGLAPCETADGTANAGLMTWECRPFLLHSPTFYHGQEWTCAGSSRDIENRSQKQRDKHLACGTERGRVSPSSHSSRMLNTTPFQSYSYASESAWSH